MKLLIDFIEDRITPSDFFDKFCQDEELQSILKEETDIRPYTNCGNLCLYIFEVNVSQMREILNLKDAVRQYLLKKEITFLYSDNMNKNFDIFYSVLPQWLDQSPEIFSSILYNKSLSNAEKKEQIKTQIKHDFRYIKKPPKWIQNPAWIIKHGKPLVFIGQLDLNFESFHDRGAVYVFLDTESGEIETVKQFY